MHTDASEAVRGLIKKKDDVEAQIKALHEVLESQGNVGMKGELVDAEGFPRNDIDVFQVRTTRHSIICLQNDHKALMADIEEALHKLHAHQRKKHERDCMETQAAAAPAVAFARVDTVSPGSPASMAGLLPGDEVVTFGSVTPQNFQNLQNIATVVQHSEGKPLRVSVLRGGSLVTLTLTPQRWSGRGLLGNLWKNVINQLQHSSHGTVIILTDLFFCCRMEYMHKYGIAFFQGVTKSSVMY